MNHHEALYGNTNPKDLYLSKKVTHVDQSEWELKPSSINISYSVIIIIFNDRIVYKSGANV